MSNILNVVVKDVEPEVVPGDDSANEATTPDTGRFTTTVLQQSNTNNPISFTPAIFVGGSIVFLAIFLALRFRNKKTFGFNKNKLSLAPKFACLLSLLCLTFGLVGLLASTYSSKATSDDDLDITVDGDTFVVERVKGKPAYAAAKAEVTLNEATAAGYDLYVYAPDGNSLVSDDTDESINTVAEENTKLTANTWGVATYTTEDITTDSAIWNPVSEAADEPTLVATTNNTTTTGDKASFYYGIYIDKDLPAGTYTTSIEYQAKPHYYTITFDANGGNIVDEDTETTTTVIIPGDELSILPDAERENHNFLGWFTEAEGGEQVTTDTVPTGSTTYYAHWQEIYTITYNANGGEVEAECALTEIINLRLVKGQKLSEAKELCGDRWWDTGFPSADRGSGFTFLGWFTEAEGGEQVTADTIPTGSTTYYAHWEGQPYTITLDVNYSYDYDMYINGHTVSAPVTLTLAAGSPLSNTKYNYNGTLIDAGFSNIQIDCASTFLGWFTAATGGTQVTADTIPTGNVTYYAHWAYSITFDATNGRTVNGSRYLQCRVTQGNTLGESCGHLVNYGHGNEQWELYEPTTSGLEYFVGWFTSCTGGTQVYASTVPTGNAGYCAHIEYNR